MADYEISAKLKQFIFEFVDSVELIEVLLLMRNQPDVWFNAAQISAELRSSPTSIAKRLSRLAHIDLLAYQDDQFRFSPHTNELKDIVSELANEYLLRRHSIFELIFSSSKNARQFADAFIVNKSKPNGESNG